MGSGRVVSPRRLIALAALATVVPLGLLLWLGWRLFDIERSREDQQARQRLEAAADLVVAGLARAVSATEEQLASGFSDWPSGSVAIEMRAGRFEARPRGRIAYEPVARMPAAALDEIDALEFGQPGPSAATDRLKTLATSADRATRVTAEFRLGRALEKSRRIDDALATYAGLATVDDVAIEGAPIALVARYRRCRVLEAEGRRQDLETEAASLARDLSSGRWPIAAPVYALYAGDVLTWAPEAAIDRSGTLLARAAEALWTRWGGPDLRAIAPAEAGRDVIAFDDGSVTVLWLKSEAGIRALLATDSYVHAQWLEPARQVPNGQLVTLALHREDAPPAPAAGSFAVVRTPALAGLGWSLTVSPVDPASWSGDLASRRWFIAAGFLVLVLLASVVTYAGVRAVGRELAVARMQSDFVSAVSHEFRTPLTSLRQFTDILREHERLDDRERGVCYEAQSRAADRLTRLVESLLDFGKMEAGARQYVFEPRDAAAFVAGVVDEFRREVEPQGYVVEVRRADAAPVDLDSEALARALWNLLDNAVKYSPEHKTLELGVERRGASVAIWVRDCGIGVPERERRVIFTRFQRGDEARRQGIKGTGIGLAMVDHIVTAHHGRIDLESEPGRGSTFTIVLPVSAAASEPAAVVRAEDQSAAGGFNPSEPVLDPKLRAQG